MAHNKENTAIFLYEEDPMFREILSALVKALEYPIVLNLEASEGMPEHLERHLGTSICLIGLSRDDQQQQGLALAQTLREYPSFVPIIFLAKIYNEGVYTICRPFRPSAFLNKEISSFKLQLALEQAFLHKHNEAQTLLKQPPPSFPRSNPFFFKTAEGFITIPEKQILYFFSSAKNTYARTAQHTYDTQVPLQILEPALQENFIRIHKSYLINVNHIETIHPNESAITIGNETLPIGYAFRKTFFNRLRMLR